MYLNLLNKSQYVKYTAALML